MDWGSVTALVLMGIAAYLTGAIPTGVLVGKWLRDQPPAGGER